MQNYKNKFTKQPFIRKIFLNVGLLLWVVNLHSFNIASSKLNPLGLRPLPLIQGENIKICIIIKTDARTVRPYFINAPS